MYIEVYEYLKNKLKYYYEVYDYYTENIKQDSCFMNISQIEKNYESDELTDREYSKKLEVELLFRIINNNKSGADYRETLYKHVESVERLLEFTGVFTQGVFISGCTIDTIYLPPATNKAEIEFFVILNIT